MSEPTSPEHGTFLMHRNRGREHFEAEEYAAARRDLELATSIRDDDADVMYWLAMAYFRLDQHAEAEELFLRLMSLRPGHASLHVTRGIALFKLERSEDAEQEFRRALELDGAGNRPHLYLGLTHARRAEYETALGHFEEAGASMLASQMRQRLGMGSSRQRNKPLAGPVPEPEIELEIEIDSMDPAATMEEPDPARAATPDEVIPVLGAAPPTLADLLAENPGSATQEAAFADARSIPLAQDDSPPESGAEDTAAAVRVDGGTFLRMTFQGIALVHRETLVGSAGSLSFENSARHEELTRVMGDGSLYLVRENRRISVLPLKAESIHLVLKCFVASQGDLASEVSTPADDTALPVRAVGLRGTGTVGVCTVGRPLMVEVRPGRPATLAAQRVAGWMGALQLSRAPMDPAAVAGGLPMVRFEGGGKVILDVPVAGPADADAAGSS